MKRSLSALEVSLLVLSLFLITWSCQREHVKPSAGNRLIRYFTDDKAVSSYILFVNMGHDGATCPGCMTVDGITFHVDCQGLGDRCAKSSHVALQEVEGGYILTTLDTLGLTSEDFCNMPARSLQYAIGEDNYVYLNIPAQLVWRDTATLQFTFTGITFSEGPVYSNN